MLRVLTCPTIVLTEQVTVGIVMPGLGQLVAYLGMDNLVIIDMPDMLLVTTQAHSQEVKRLVKKVKDAGWHWFL
jgi:mannose-1-phosphate guanylyltransferase